MFPSSLIESSVGGSSFGGSSGAEQKRGSLAEPRTATDPFEGLAADYDRDFSDSLLGTIYRRAVARQLERSFDPGMRVLDLGCGTGEDALFLARAGVAVTAIDRSRAMVEIARQKVEQAGLAESVDVRRLEIEAVDRLLTGECARRPTDSVSSAPVSAAPASAPRRSSTARPSLFDGAYSNFGALNCVHPLRDAATKLGRLLRPGAPLVLCVMGPVAIWEWAWFLARADPARAFRRLRKTDVLWRGLRIRYPSIRALCRAFAPEFGFRGACAIGVLLPPPPAEKWAARHLLVTRALDRWERRVEAWPPLPWLGDHVVVTLERRSDRAQAVSSR